MGLLGFANRGRKRGTWFVNSVTDCDFAGLQTFEAELQCPENLVVKLKRFFSITIFGDFGLRSLGLCFS